MWACGFSWFLVEGWEGVIRGKACLAGDTFVVGVVVALC